jgi:hypothetical protein
MAESVEHAFMGEDAVGKRQLCGEIAQFIRHGRP